MPRDNRIPTLDGWRGIAILMVLSEHFVIGFVKHRFFGSEFLQLGQHGVTVFFVLSGYLITSSLLAQERINLRSFYIRRFFRLMPAAWTYLLVLGLLTLLTPLKVIGEGAWGCLFFFRNYMAPNPAWFNTGHFWSLSVEEQFYLAWPGLPLLLGNKKAAWLAGIAAVGFSIYRIVNWGPDEYQNFARTPMCVDKLMIGCLLALLLSNGRVRQSFERNGRLIFTSSFAFFLIDIEFFRHHSASRRDPDRPHDRCDGNETADARRPHPRNPLSEAPWPHVLQHVLVAAVPFS